MDEDLFLSILLRLDAESYRYVAKKIEGSDRQGKTKTWLIN